MRPGRTKESGLREKKAGCVKKKAGCVKRERAVKKGSGYAVLRAGAFVDLVDRFFFGFSASAAATAFVFFVEVFVRVVVG
jgi:hypothetical protein